MAAKTKLFLGAQGEPIFVPASLDDDPDLQPTTEYGRKLLQKLEAEQRSQSVCKRKHEFALFNEHRVNPHAVLIEAYGIAGEEGLLDEGWRIELDDDPVNAGTCTESTKTIKLSLRWMTSVAEACDTYLHEIAHALQTRHHGTAFEAVLHEMRHRHNRVD